MGAPLAGCWCSEHLGWTCLAVTAMKLQTLISGERPSLALHTYTTALPHSPLRTTVYRGHHTHYTCSHACSRGRPTLLCSAYIYGTNAWIAAYPTTPALETSYNYVNKSQLSASKTAKAAWNKGEGAGSSSPVMLVISSHEYSKCTYFTLESTRVA